MHYYLIPFCTNVLKKDELNYFKRIPDFLLEEEPELKQFLNFVIEYREEHGVMPDENRLSLEGLDGFCSNKHSLNSSPLTDLFTGFIDNLKQDKLTRVYEEHTQEEKIDYTSFTDKVKKLERISSKPIKAMGVLDGFEDYEVDNDNDEYISSGFPHLDSVTGGMARGDYLLIAAQTGTGKSTLLTNQAWRGMVSGMNTLYINKEERKIDIKRRLYAIAGGFNNICFRHKNSRNLATLEASKPIALKRLNDLKLKGGNIWFPDNKINEIQEIGGIIEDFAKRGIIIDQLCVDNSYLFGGKNDMDWKVIRSNSVVLRDIALEQNTRVFCTTQLSNNGESLAYSTQMKQDCTMMVTIKNNSKGSYMNVRMLDVFIEKNRYGADGSKAPVMALKINYDLATVVMENDLTGQNLLNVPLI